MCLTAQNKTAGKVKESPIHFVTCTQSRIFWYYYLWIVKSSVDKFFGTDLEDILNQTGVDTVIIVGTAAEGAVLHTVTGACIRGFNVIVPVDGLSSSFEFAEQYTIWHLANSPGTKKRTTLTRLDMISF